MSSYNCDAAIILLFISVVLVFLISGSISSIGISFLTIIIASIVFVFFSSGFISLMTTAFMMLIIAVFVYIIGNSASQMNKKLFKTSFLTRWSFSHFMLYFILGSLCPHHLKQFMIIGLSWEIIESIISFATNSSHLWKGQIVDLVMNFLGYKFSELFYGVFYI